MVYSVEDHLIFEAIIDTYKTGFTAFTANAQKGYTYDAGSYHSGHSAEIWGTEIGAGVDGGGRCVDCMQSTL